MDFRHISIIGGGNLGMDIAQGLRKEETFNDIGITVTRRDLSHIEFLREQNVELSTDNATATSKADVVILAVQPGQMKKVLAGIMDEVFPKKIIVSVATGFSIEQIEEFVGSEVPVFRCMPNTAIAVQESMTCMASNKAGKSKRDVIQSLFSPLGETAVIPERLLQAATVLCASGIAFWMRFIRATTQGGIQLGFESEIALKIAMQTCLGAATLLKKNGSHPEAEIDHVTTPKGCTITGLNEMEHNGLSSAVIKGLNKSFEKINEIKADQIK
ncbi:MAG: pyrroline-5-carboxylate reductase [Flavobacteriales bacterium]|nr:pyrroline-5-carboxylate reductase [Flavobacteriales bacterium]